MISRGVILQVGAAAVCVFAGVWLDRALLHRDKPQHAAVANVNTPSNRFAAVTNAIAETNPVVTSVGDAEPGLNGSQLEAALKDVLAKKPSAREEAISQFVSRVDAAALRDALALAEKVTVPQARTQLLTELLGRLAEDDPV